MIVHSADGVFAIRKGPWKWIEGVPVDEIKPGARKAQADQFKPQLYNTHDDPAETKNVSAEHPEIVKELSALLNRYRDGGYMNVCMHPFVSGRALRIAMLDRLINRMKALPGVWFPSCEEVARHILKGAS
mgnify:CR=1 FL=1